MDSFLITLAILLLSAVVNWLGRKRTGNPEWTDEPSDAPPPIPRPRPEYEAPPALPQPAQMPKPARQPYSSPPLVPESRPAQMQKPAPQPRPAIPVDWERELRRLLGDESPAAPPPKPPPVRPMVVVDDLPPPVSRPTRTPPAPSLETIRPLASLKQASKAHSRAQQLQREVADRLKKVDEQTVQHRPAVALQKTQRTAEAQGARRLIRDPQRLREAFVVSMILSPPKALETAEK